MSLLVHIARGVVDDGTRFSGAWACDGHHGRCLRTAVRN